jgi:hypothetical protein
VCFLTPGLMTWLGEEGAWPADLGGAGWPKIFPILVVLSTLVE